MSCHKLISSGYVFIRWNLSLIECNASLWRVLGLTRLLGHCCCYCFSYSYCYHSGRAASSGGRPEGSQPRARRCAHEVGRAGERAEESGVRQRPERSEGTDSGENGWLNVGKKKLRDRGYKKTDSFRFHRFYYIRAGRWTAIWGKLVS